MVVDAVARQRGRILSTSIAGAFPDRLPQLKEAEELLLTEALRRADGNQGVAASMLGITRQAVNQRLMRRKQPDLPARSRR